MDLTFKLKMIRVMALIPLAVCSYSAQSTQGEIILNSYSWSSDGSGGIIVDRASASVKTPGLICDFFAQHNISGECGVALGIETDRTPGIISVKSIYSGPIASFTAQQQADGVNSIVGHTYTQNYFQKGFIIASCLYSYYKDSSGSENYIPFDGVCSTAPLPPAPVAPSCKFSGKINIDYGNLSTQNVPGAKKTGSTVITCDQDTTVNLKVYDKNTNTNVVFLRDNKSLSAMLTIDGVDTSSSGKNINVKANEPTPILIDSELKTEGTPDAGDFEGSAIATISIP